MNTTAYTFKIKKDVPMGYWYSHLAGMEITVIECQNSDLAPISGLPNRIKDNYFMDVTNKNIILREHCEK